MNLFKYRTVVTGIAICFLSVCCCSIGNHIPQQLSSVSAESAYQHYPSLHTPFGQTDNDDYLIKRYLKKYTRRPEERTMVVITIAAALLAKQIEQLGPHATSSLVNLYPGLPNRTAISHYVYEIVPNLPLPNSVKRQVLWRIIVETDGNDFDCAAAAIMHGIPLPAPKSMDMLEEYAEDELALDLIVKAISGGN